MIEGVEIFGIDSLIRPGSELNRRSLPKYGCKIFYGDVRSRSDLDQLPSVDWVIDAAANPSVSAGVDGIRFQPPIGRTQSARDHQRS